MVYSEHDRLLNPDTRSDGDQDGLLSPDAATDESAGPTRDRRSVRDAFGAYGLIFLAVGTVCLVTPLIILGLLWSGSVTVARNPHPAGFWLHVVSNNWATKTVAVCSTTMRVAIELQCVLLAAMVASLILQRDKAKFVDAAELAVVRTFNIGPESWILSVSRSRKALLWRIACSAALVLTALLIVVSQFLSTILLSDFGDVVVQEQHNHTWPASYGISVNGEQDPHQTGSAVDLWSSRPATWRRFAEYMENPETGIGFDDTGTVIRAYLPIDKQKSRETLRQYTGPATLVDSRVVCTSPTVRVFASAIGFMDNEENPDDRVDTLDLLGSLTFDDSYPAIWHANATQEVPFYCSVTIVDNEAQGLQVSVCTVILNGRPVLQTSRPVPLTKKSDPTWELPDLISTLPRRAFLSTTTFMLLQTTGTHDAWTRLARSGKDFNFVRSGDEQQPWSIATATTTAGTVTVSLTACMTIMDSVDYIAEMNSSSDMQEAVLGRDPESKAYYTDDVLYQLGDFFPGPAPSLLDRGILELRHPLSWWSYIQNPVKSPGAGRFATHTYFTDFIPSSLPELDVSIWIMNKDGNNITVPTALSTVPCGYLTLMQGRTSGKTNQVNRAHATIFQDVLTVTGSPARALQAVLTTLSQMSYYGYVTSLLAVLNSFPT